MSEPRYPDCESCAFYNVEEAICDECDEADQWEPADEDPNLPIEVFSNGQKVFKPVKTKFKWRNAA